MLLVDWTGRLTVHHKTIISLYPGVCRQIVMEMLSASESPKITTVDICLLYIP